MNVHQTRLRIRIHCCTVVIGLILTPGILAQDWPALRGENGSGSINPNGILANSNDIQLEVRWKKKIGSGYSSVVFERDRLVVLYTLGSEDVIECLDTRDGRSIWRERIDAKFAGENGSFDGPLATPVLDQGRIFGLTPRGKLFCRSIDDGREIWSRDLVKEEKATQPLYGFVSSPLIAGGNVIVQVGAKDKAVAAFSRDDGHTVWAVGNDEISSQSPARIVVEGREVVLSAGGKKLMGIDPLAGKVLFEFEHGGGNGSSMVPVAMENSSVLLTLDDSFSKAVALTLNNDQLTASQKWQDRSIKNTYNVPALVNHWVFAFSTRFLTCVDPETGAAKWKDRNPGDGFLIAVDGKLIISTKSGSLHIAEASAEGYRELAQLKLFDDLVWSVPAFGDNAIYQRSLGEVACVNVVSGKGASLANANSEEGVGSKFAAFLERIDSEPNASAKQEIVDRFLTEQSTFPIVEGEHVHFVYSGPASDVALAGDMFGARQERAMTRVPGTNFFYHAMQLPSDQRANYIFLIDYQPQLDPRNPRRVRSSMYAGEMEFAIRLTGEKPLEMNWFAMGDWQAPTWQADLPTTAQAEIVSEKIKSEISKREVSFDVCTPPGYASEAKNKRYPTIYVTDGPGAKEFGRLPDIANALYRDHPDRAPILILVNSLEGDPSGGTQFVDVLAKEIVPFVDSKYATIADRDSRTLMGLGFTSHAALFALAKHSEVFSALSAQSPLLFDHDRSEVGRLFAKIKLPTRVYVEWGRFDMFNPHENWDLRTISEQIFDSLHGNPQVRVSGGMVNDSTDWSSWQNRFEQVLSFLVGT